MEGWIVDLRIKKEDKDLKVEKLKYKIKNSILNI